MYLFTENENKQTNPSLFIERCQMKIVLNFPGFRVEMQDISTMVISKILIS